MDLNLTLLVQQRTHTASPGLGIQNDRWQYEFDEQGLRASKVARNTQRRAALVYRNVGVFREACRARPGRRYEPNEKLQNNNLEKGRNLEERFI